MRTVYRNDDPPEVPDEPDYMVSLRCIAWKPIRCSCCGETIHLGETYTRWKWAWEDEPIRTERLHGALYGPGDCELRVRRMIEAEIALEEEIKNWHAETNQP